MNIERTLGLKSETNTGTGLNPHSLLLFVPHWITDDQIATFAKHFSSMSPRYSYFTGDVTAGPWRTDLCT